MLIISRAIPILDLYQSYIRDNDVKVVMLCANNYPAKLQLNFGIDNLFYFNDLVRIKTANSRKNGLQLVEVSDDFWEIGQLINPDDVINNDKLFHQLNEKARESQLYFVAMGTGALFSYKYKKQQFTPFYDIPINGQEFDLGIYYAWLDFAARMGIQLYTGRRISTANGKYIKEKIKLSNISKFIGSISCIDLCEINTGDLDPDTVISKSEAMNLAIHLMINRHNPKIMQLVEQMQYQGMEPNTVEQVIRFNKFIKANVDWDYFGDMADNGHVAVRGTRNTNNQDDYDLFAYAENYIGPILFIHHNILYKNMKEPGTKANLERDLNAKKGLIDTDGMPFPERIRDINDYLIRSIQNPNLKYILVSPEPKCNFNTDINYLAQAVAEATLITADSIIDTGLFDESSMIPFTFVSNGKVNEFDDLLKELIFD